jgi:hypothetical protein
MKKRFQFFAHNSAQRLAVGILKLGQLAAQNKSRESEVGEPVEGRGHLESAVFQEHVRFRRGS